MVQKQREQRRRTPKRIAGGDYYTVREAAAELGVSASTIWRWIDAGQLAASRVGPRAIRIRAEDVRTAVSPTKYAVHEQPYVKHSDISKIPSLTDEDRRRMKEAVAAIHEFRERLMATRKGRLFPDSAKIIREERAKRSRHLADLANKARR